MPSFGGSAPSNPRQGIRRNRRADERERQGLVEAFSAMGEREGTSGISVEYESETTTGDQLIGVVNTLPSFYRGRFVAREVGLKHGGEDRCLPEA